MSLEEKFKKYTEVNPRYRGTGRWFENELSEEEQALCIKLKREGHYSAAYISEFLVSLGHEDATDAKLRGYFKAKGIK